MERRHVPGGLDPVQIRDSTNIGETGVYVVPIFFVA